MRSELYEALRAATEGDFELLGELDCDDGWIAYLAAAPRDGALAILLLHETPDDGQFDLQVVQDLDGSLPVGRTSCPACGAAADGWPRFCGACRRDLSGIAADAAVPGSSPAELLQAVREASAGVYEVLGAMRHAEGGGAMYFAREDGGRIVGLVLENEADGGLSLVRSWAYDHEALAGASPAAAWTPGEPAAPAPAYAEVSAAEPGPVLFAETADAAPALLYGEAPGPASGRRFRRPTRRMAYGVAGALLLAAGVALAVVVVRQTPPPVEAVASVTPTVTAPAPTPTQPVPAFIDSATLTPPAPTQPQQASHPAPRPRPRPAAQQPQPAVREPEPVQPSAEADRQAVLDAVARYADAVESRQMGRIRAAYPGISSEEAGRWAEWFGRFTRGVDLAVSHSVSDGPSVQGDAATVVFTLTMRYQGQRHQVTSRGTLRRSGRGWTLQELRALQ
jgi:hypothetical protein